MVTAPDPIQQAFGVTKVYDSESVAPVPNSTTGNWSRGETMTGMRSVSQDNPLRLGDSEVGVVYQVAGLRTEQEIIGLNSDRVFEENGAITDLSYYTERQTSTKALRSIPSFTSPKRSLQSRNTTS